MPTKFQLITELYDQTVQSVTGSYQSWTGFLRAACYNYKCPFDDQILIYAQRPDATAVLEMERWNRQFGRWVNRGAKSIAVFGDDGQNCLKLYFDVSDTHASRFARPLPIWTMHPAFEPEVIETLEATFGNLAEKENLADAVRSACHNAVADNFTDYLQDLRECREDSLLEELDDLNLEVFYRDALEVSVAYMLMTRLGLRADDYFSPDEFAHVYEFNTPPTINALGIATSDIAEMGLREISRTVMQAQRDQFFANRARIGYDDRTEQHETPHERSEQHGGHLQDAERLSGAEPADAADAGGASGQVRGAAERISEEAPQGALHQPQDQRQADGAFGGDRADRAEDGGADRGTDGAGRGRDGGAESNRSPALDGPDEQSPAQRGGTGADRPDLRLTTEEPTEAGSDELPASAVIDAAQPTIKELFEQYKQTVAAALVKDTAFVNACRNSDRENAIMEGADAIRRIVNESGDLQLAKLYFDMPAFHNRLHQELLEETYPKLVNAADHSPFKPYQVAAYHHFENGFDDKLDYQTLEEAEAAAQGYVAGTMEKDGFAYDGAAVYDAETRQCLRVYGDYPDEKAQEQAAAFALEHDAVTPNGTELPAFLDMHLIEANLLDDGGRKHKRQEIFEYFQAHKNLAERTEFLKNSYNDIWVEVLTDGVRTGYHAEKDGLLMWEGSYLSRTSESVFSWSVITEMTEGLIERGEYKIKLGLQNAPIVAEQLALFDMGDDAPVYEAPADAPSGILAPARTVPQEVIDQALYTAGNEPGSAERIAMFYMREHSEQENIAFLRREFGTENGRGIEYEGRKYAVWFLEDGIHLAQGDSVRTGYSKTVVSWGLAAGRILGLLRAGIYLSAAELTQAPDKVLHEAMDALLMTARDLTKEGRDMGLLPQTLAIHDQHKGYPELDEDMVAFAKTDGGLQMLAQEYHAFLDAYYDDPSILRYRLSAYNTHRIGIPENEIAFIHNAKSEVQKKDLFGKVRSGQVRILLGSTQRMGAGTNCQQKLIALHHLDCPWRPSDLQQREGRIIRQGNENKEVDIYSYVTEGTFDAYLYQLVESKQKFISQIMTSKSPVRSAEDVDEQALSYAEIKALASGNPMIKEKMDLDIEVSKLKLLKANHLSQKYALEDAISKDFPKQIAETQVRIAGYGADIATVKENTHPNGDGFSPLTLAGVTHADKKEAGAALLTMCQTMLSPAATQIGSYRGLTLELSFDTFAREYHLTMIGQLRHTVTLGTDVFGNLQRMDNALEGLPIKEQTCREQLSNLQTQLETAKVEVQKPFPREAELNTKTARLEELNSLLNLDHKEPEIVDAEPDEDQRPPERRRPQLER